VDIVTCFSHLDQTAYLLLVYEDADDNLIRISPNRSAVNKLFPAGTTIEVSDTRGRFEFEILRRLTMSGFMLLLPPVP